DFHASVPLEAVREHAILIYQFNGEPLPLAAGGPVRFYIRDFAACQADDVDECANVKFLDRIELSVDRGFDNRPTDEESHEELHRRQEGETSQQRCDLAGHGVRHSPVVHDVRGD
ncbi:MAG: molybdopterin-dependent oxidoreductase, partial [Chloroflexi bacterium]|nr:molybdopterin-dependent oxidoreductase [Chloroflexota bacterium]